MKRIKLVLMLVVLSIVMVGCIKPYARPIIEVIENNETAFLIQLQGENIEGQDMFESVAYLEENKVASREVVIPVRWQQTGRMNWMGHHRPTAKLIRVNRAPTTREWNAMPESGTSSRNQGIISESKESISFVLSANITAQIEEKNTSEFLYRYNSSSLSDVMDNQIRAMVESETLSITSAMALSEIQANRGYITEELRDRVVPFFAEQGITISVLGFAGEIEYLDPTIQEEINRVFREQRSLEAQKITNERIIEEETAKAEAELRGQQLRNQKEVETAEARAEAARLMEGSLEFQIRMKELENQKLFFEQFDGKLPQIMGGDSGFLLNLGDFE